jgi:hypothetical protein
MTKKIFAGNFVNYLSSYQGQPIVAIPGYAHYHKIGYAKADATNRTVLDVIVPSPDKRPDDKPRPDIVGLVVPANALVYKVGIRLVDRRKELDRGAPRSGIVGTNTDRIKLASAVNTAVGGSITSGVIGTNTANLVIANTTVAPGQSKLGLVTPTTIGASALTLSVYSTATGGTTAGSGISSNELGGSFFVCEVAYVLPNGDDVPDESAFGGFPALVESV